MFRKHRWLVIAGLVLAQVGIIVCYQGFLRGSSEGPVCPGCCPASKPQTAEPPRPADPKPAQYYAQATPAPAALTVPTSLPDTLPPPSCPEPLPPAPTDYNTPVAANEPPPAAPLAPPPVDALVPTPPTSVLPNGTLVPVQAPTVDTLPPAPVAPLPEIPQTRENPVPPISVEPPIAPYIPAPPPVSVQPTAPIIVTPPTPVEPPPPAMPTIAPPARLGTPETMPTPIQQTGVAARNTVEPTQPEAIGPCPWTLKMTIIDGMTVIEARIGKEIQFRIVCEKLDLQSPRGSINAQGDVKISGTGLDGHCQRLLINWTDDRLLVEGNAYLKCLRDGHDVELNAERMSLRLSESTSIKGVGLYKVLPVEELSELREPRDPSKNLSKPPSPIRAE